MDAFVKLPLLPWQTPVIYTDGPADNGPPVGAPLPQLPAGPDPDPLVYRGPHDDEFGLDYEDEPDDGPELNDYPA